MAISSETSKVQYSGDGSTTAFTVNFFFIEDGDLEVVLTSAAGVNTVQTITTEYTLTGAGDQSGGTCTMVTAPATGEKLTIRRKVPITQTVDYVENDPFPADTHERALDKLTMIAQEQSEEIGRSIKFSVSSTSTDVVMPDPVADQYLKWNSGGTALESITLSSSAGLGNLVEDTTPQLGGDLGTNSNNILIEENDLIIFEGATADAFETTLSVVDPTADRTILLPDASDTLVGKATTDTLTNKTLDANSNTITDLPYDIAFIAGFSNTMVKEDVAVQTYGELVMSRTGEIVGEAGYADTAPTGANLIIDIEKNGTSIYTTKPQFAATSQTLTAGTLKTDGSEDFVSGDRITFKITQIGSTEPGEGIRFTVKCEV